jgi:hypothetical protein
VEQSAMNTYFPFAFLSTEEVENPKKSRHDYQTSL